MTAFEDYLQAELPKRSALETYETVSYDGDPNSGSAPAALQGAPKGTWFLQQTGTIFWRKRTSAANSWIIASINETYEEMDIYVRAADGSDSNLGTISEPLATLTEAVNRIPFHVNHTIRIHVGPHTGSGYQRPTISQKALNENIYIIGDGGGGVTDGFTEILSSTAALAGSTDRIVKSSGLSTSQYGGFGQYWGATIEILSGAAAGDRRTILNNTATDIVPNAPFTAAIGTGDLYRIVTPETTIYYTDQNNTILCSGLGVFIDEQFAESRGKSLFLINFKVDTNQSVLKLSMYNSSVIFLGVELSKKSNLLISSGTAISGIESVNGITDYNILSVVADLGVPNQKSWAGWGMSIRNQTAANGYLYLYGYGLFFGSLNVQELANVRCRVDLFFGSIWRGDFSALSNGDESIITIAPIFMDIKIGSLTTSPKGIVNSGNLKVFSFGSNTLYVKSSGNGLECDSNGLTLLNILIAGGLNIETSSGIGMLTKTHGKIRASSNPPVISASGNDFSEDNGTTIRAISVLALNTSFSHLFHGSIYRGF